MLWSLLDPSLAAPDNISNGIWMLCHLLGKTDGADPLCPISDCADWQPKTASCSKLSSAKVPMDIGSIHHYGLNVGGLLLIKSELLLIS